MAVASKAVQAIGSFGTEKEKTLRRQPQSLWGNTCISKCLENQIYLKAFLKKVQSELMFPLVSCTLLRK